MGHLVKLTVVTRLPATNLKNHFDLLIISTRNWKKNDFVNGNNLLQIDNKNTSCCQMRTVGNLVILISTTRLPTTNLKNDDDLQNAQIKGLDFANYGINWCKLVRQLVKLMSTTRLPAANLQIMIVKPIFMGPLKSIN